jgi:hypothetical protein
MCSKHEQLKALMAGPMLKDRVIKKKLAATYPLRWMLFHATFCMEIYSKDGDHRCARYPITQLAPKVSSPGMEVYCLRACETE